VDIEVEGVYTLKYVGQDAAGNESDTLTRDVIVLSEEVCDQCIPMIMLEGDTSNYHHASDTLMITGTLSGDQNLIIKAGTEIEFLPVFEMEPGAILQAIIEECTPASEMTAEELKELIKSKK